jgi:hypothetical protein
MVQMPDDLNNVYRVGPAFHFRCGLDLRIVNVALRLQYEKRDSTVTGVSNLSESLCNLSSVASSVPIVASFVMTRRSRRLDDRIHKLSVKVSSPKDADELRAALPELKSAIHEAIERLRERAANALSGQRLLPAERRKHR